MPPTVVSSYSARWKVAVVQQVSRQPDGAEHAGDDRTFLSRGQTEGVEIGRAMSAPFVERGPLANSVVATVAPMVTAAMISPTPMRPPPLRQ
ncbi:MAG: hypothetical protein ACLSHC_00675 [Bilophila wadsworthia]